MQPSDFHPTLFKVLTVPVPRNLWSILDLSFKYNKSDLWNFYVRPYFDLEMSYARVFEADGYIRAPSLTPIDSPFCIACKHDSRSA